MPIIAEDQKCKTTANSNGFEGRALTKYNCTKCTTTTSTTQFVSLLQDKNNGSACNNVPSYWEWI